MPICLAMGTDSKLFIMDQTVSIIIIIKNLPDRQPRHDHVGVVDRLHFVHLKLGDLDKEC
jgi:hypothetical protein